MKPLALNLTLAQYDMLRGALFCGDSSVRAVEYRDINVEECFALRTEIRPDQICRWKEMVLSIPTSTTRTYVTRESIYKKLCTIEARAKGATC